MTSSSSVHWKRLLADVAFIAGALCWFLWLGQHRLIARDEGFYTIAAKLIAAGQVPYRDFFFPQGPVSATILARFFTLLDCSWSVARIYAAVFSTATLSCLWFYCTRRYGWYIGVIASLFALVTNILFVWLPTAQTYPVSAFFMLLSCTLLCWPEVSQSRKRIFLAGACIALAGLTRFYLIALFLPAFVIVALTRQQDRTKALVMFSLGFIIPLGFFMLLHSAFLDSVWFNLVGYHLLRSGESFTQSLPQKLQILGIVTGALPTAKFASNQIAYLFWLLGLTSFLKLYWHRTLSYWHFLVFCITMLSLVPSPTYVQYFCLVVPFLVIAIADDLYALSTQIGTKPVNRSILIPVLLFAVFYTRSLGEDVTRYTRSGVGVIGIYNASGAKIWNLPYTRRVSARLNQFLPRPATLFSFWPGYLLETHHIPLQGFENHFSIRVADELTALQQSEFKMGSISTLANHILEGSVDALLIDGNRTQKSILIGLEESGFEKSKNLRFPSFYIRTNQGLHSPPLQ